MPLTLIRSLSMFCASWLLLAVLCCQRHGQRGGVSEESDDSSLLMRLQPHLKIEWPKGEGRFPAMALVSGCSGFYHPRFRASYDRYSDRFVELGFAVARVDFLNAHGLQNACQGPQNPSGETISEQEIAKYVHATASYLAQEDRIDPDRIFLAGWSLGGGGVLASLAALAETEAHSIAGVIAFFPSCGGLQPWTADVPTLLLLGELDNITPASVCEALVEAADPAHSVVIHKYPRAHHSFDVKELPIVKEPRRETTIAYNPEAAQAAWAEVLGFLNAN